MKVTVELLEEKDACPEAVAAFRNQDEQELIPLLKKMIKGKWLEWANWLIVRCMAEY